MKLNALTHIPSAGRGRGSRSFDEQNSDRVRALFTKLEYQGLNIAPERAAAATCQ
jgi:hypothetical protein